MAEPATPELSDKTLTGDIRDFLLVWIRNMKKPFEAMSESDQRDLIDAVEGSARELVGGVIAVVSGRGFEKAFVKLGKFSVGDGIEAKIITDRSERNLLNFNDFAGRSAMLIFADPAEFDGARAPARVFKRQRDIEEAIADQKAAEAQPTTTTEAKPKKEKKPKPEKAPVKTTDVDTSKGSAWPLNTEAPKDLIDPNTGEVLDASKSTPRDLGDPPRLNENETVDPITGEIVTIKPAASLDDLFSQPATAAPEPDAVLVEEVLLDPATGKETVWHKNPAPQPEPQMPELPSNLRRVTNPAKPGTLDPDDPGEPEAVTVNNAPTVSKGATDREPQEDELDDFPS